LKNSDKIALRKVLLEKRDSISFDLIKINSKKIHEKLKRIDVYNDADSIACYYSIGSEVMTHSIIQELLDKEKTVSLPRVANDELNFHKVTDLKNLENGSFDIMEPRDDAPVVEKFDVILVPTIGVSYNGTRLGYGHGFYDRFLANTNSTKISLTYSKQIVKSIPATESDIKMDWIVTEEKFSKIC
jgi:5-formyltetrahydrofolate cyclo-ligase